VSNLAVDRGTGPAEDQGLPDTDAPTLAIPEGWVIDELARDRLARQLARAPDHIRGVVAETGALHPGASYRVHAERQCLEPLSAVVETTRDAVHGAVLLRPGIAFEADDGVVQVERGPLLVDPGAHVHNPWRQVVGLEPASALGRPPFPRRPVVVLLACEPDVEVLDWARSLVNNLVRRDVEARLAMLEISEGLHLTQPCLPREETIQALRPDVIVALDKTALDEAPAWCGGDRSCVVVELTPDVAATAELVSWQLERARGRVRARIGRRIDAPSFVSLVNRLCAGPHPIPPTDAGTPTAAVVTVRALLKRAPAPMPEPPRRRSVMALTGDGDSAGQAALPGLLDHLNGAGHAAEMVRVGNANPSAICEADVVVIGAGNGTEVNELMASRRLAGRPTIANVGLSDILTGAWPPDAFGRPTAAPAGTTSSVAALTGSAAVYEHLHALGVRAYLLPHLLPREFASELRSARAARNRFSDPVIGWHAGSAGFPASGYTDAVVDALVKLLAERPHLSVETDGDQSRVPAGFLAHPRVSALSARPGGEALSRWIVQLWSPPVLDDDVADDTRPFVEASAVGVPTVLPQPAQAAIAWYPSPGALVERFDQSDDWVAGLRSLLDNDVTWSRQSAEAMRRFDVMHSAGGSDVAVNRFLGWALYKEAHQ
jgi:hypothetical protein